MMKTSINKLLVSSIKPLVSVTAMVSTLLLTTQSVQAYDLQANTIYANTSDSIYSIDVATATATKVADAKTGFTKIQDIAFDGNTLYGMAYSWQLFKMEPSESDVTALNNASSYSLQFRGLESRSGKLYGAETRSLLLIDKTTVKPAAPGPGAMGYGVGSGEVVTDLAFSAQGILYASVSFNSGSDYLASINPETGEMTLIGNTFIYALRALTVKDNVVYGMSSVGDLFTINTVNGMGTLLKEAVLPGVYGMGTSPEKSSSGNGDDSASAGSLSYSLIGMFLLLIISRLVNTRSTEV